MGNDSSRHSRCRVKNVLYSDDDILIIHSDVNIQIEHNTPKLNKED